METQSLAGEVAEDADSRGGILLAALGVLLLAAHAPRYCKEVDMFDGSARSRSA